MPFCEVFPSHRPSSIDLHRLLRQLPSHHARTIGIVVLSSRSVCDESHTVQKTRLCQPCACWVAHMQRKYLTELLNYAIITLDSRRDERRRLLCSGQREKQRVDMPSTLLHDLRPSSMWQWRAHCREGGWSIGGQLPAMGVPGSRMRCIPAWYW
jgi:hypothetical protein